MTRETRLNYERRILAAEVETVRIAQRAKRFAELIQRNTQTLDAALTVANFDADRRGHDRMVVEPWMPALLSLLDDLSQVLPDEDDNQKRLFSEEQPKSVVNGADKVRHHLSEARCIMYDEHWLADAIDRFFASCDRSGEAGETPKSGSTEGESAVGATSAETPEPGPIAPVQDDYCGIVVTDGVQDDDVELRP